MATEVNIDVEANIELADDRIKKGQKTIKISELTGKDLLKIKGDILCHMKTMLFDVRSTGYDGEKFTGTDKQWKEYIGSLPCAICKKIVTKCKC